MIPLLNKHYQYRFLSIKKSNLSGKKLTMNFFQKYQTLLNLMHRKQQINNFHLQIDLFKFRMNNELQLKRRLLPLRLSSKSLLLKLNRFLLQCLLLMKSILSLMNLSLNVQMYHFLPLSKKLKDHNLLIELDKLLIKMLFSFYFHNFIY